jgi:hypothetical protein
VRKLRDSLGLQLKKIDREEKKRERIRSKYK